MVPKSPSIEIAATKISFLHLIFPSVCTVDADLPSELSCVSVTLQAFRFPQLYVISHSQEQLQSLVCPCVMVFALCLNTGIIVPAIIWKFYPSAGSYSSTSIPSPADEAQSRPLKNYKSLGRELHQDWDLATQSTWRITSKISSYRKGHWRVPNYQSSASTIASPLGDVTAHIGLRKTPTWLTFILWSGLTLTPLQTASLLKKEKGRVR